MDAVVVRNLRKSYRAISGHLLFLPLWREKEVLHGVSFRLRKGEFVGLVGPNGAGKTTTVKLLTGILQPDGGDVRVNGYVPSERRKDFFRSIGVLFGNRSSLVFDLPVRDSFLLWKDVYGMDDGTYEQRLEMFDHLLGLGELLDTPTRKLSFGQRMRAEIAVTFLHRPKVVFLDEPTIALDAAGKVQVYDFLRYINRKEKATIILTTHNLAEIELLCRRMILLSKGRILWDGSLKRFMDKHVREKKVFAEIVSGRSNIAEKYGLKREGRIIKGTIPREKQIRFVEDLLRNHRLSNLSLSDPSLEEILSEVYGDG